MRLDNNEQRKIYGKHSFSFGWHGIFAMRQDCALVDPEMIASAGERIYAERYKDAFEKKYADQFVAIDVNTEQAFIAPFAEDAIEKALTDAAGCTLHLVRVGAASAYEMSFFLAA